ncbi:hypothetical protein KFK09_010862 [Dendrobium nobile]|uniref:Uncharacterized protein n=1 Tax=Dendrobium nobile TaxID=94219 RepID=A0A8T3BDZ7_DENNO|nr:hypothetical protein KFK09_010862 [Dendrobium nobile]
MSRRGDGRGGFYEERYQHPPVSGERGGRSIGRSGNRGRVGGETRSRGPRFGRGGAMPPQQERPTPSSSSSASGLSSLSKAFEERVQIHNGITENGTAEFPAPTAASSVDSAILSAETATEAVVPLGSSTSVVHPLRPGFGSVGRKIMIRVNHFLVEVEDKNIFQYSVKIEPEVESRAFGRMVMKKLIDGFGELHLGQLKLAYDGRNIFYTAGQLPFTSKDFELTVIERRSRKRTYTVSIEFTKGFDLHPLKQFLKGRQRDCPHETIQALDVVLREFPSENYVSVSRSFFSTKFGNKEAIGGGLECWRGYYQSLRPTQIGLSLNLDISATSFFKPVKLMDFVSESLELKPLPKVFSEHLRMQANKILKGVRVETTHNSKPSRCYKITGLTSQPANKLLFSVDGQADTTISVAQYFKDRYKYNLLYASYPCVQAGNSKKPVYLPMEVCKIVEGQRYSKKLNEQQVANMLRATCKRPAVREDGIMKIWSQNSYTDDMHAKEFGITVDRHLQFVEARILPPPKLKYHNNGRERTCNPSLGKWNMIGKRMVNGGTVDSWACICFAGRVSEDAIYYFCNELVGMCNNIGMVFNCNPAVEISFWPPSQVENGLRDLYHLSIEKLNHEGKHLQMLIVVLPEASGSYGRIKTICETELGLVTQCCKPTKVLKCDKQYLENIALKINVKVGGRNTVLEDAFNKTLPFISDAPTIIFGADVTHPSPGEDSQSSIAAVVASMDWPLMTTYRCLISSQQHRQEMIQDLFASNADPKRGNVAGGMVRELLQEFYKVTNRKPNRIIFYRDGVSEGQYAQVLLYEVDAIRKACTSLDEDYLPPVTFVVVQKRHHTRLFPADHHQKDLIDRSGNILPGTVVDRAICHPTEFDFYLCSHSGIQGTSRPTHYHVLFDENKFSADALQSLTYNLCYTYARCTRSVCCSSSILCASCGISRSILRRREAGIQIQSHKH